MNTQKLFLLAMSYTAFTLATTTITISDSGDSNVPGGGNYVSNTNTDLRGAINHINQTANPPGGFEIRFPAGGTILLEGVLPPFGIATNAAPLVAMGNASDPFVTIEGSSTYPGIITYQGDISFTNINFDKCASIGGNGGAGNNGGNGALGAGGALFVAPSATVTVGAVNFTNSSAVGGNAGNSIGGTGGGGGGGGMFGGVGGDAALNGAAGGGGGLGSEGGAASGTHGGGGGGIGVGGASTIGQGGSGDAVTGPSGAPYGTMNFGAAGGVAFFPVGPPNGGLGGPDSGGGGSGGTEAGFGMPGGGGGRVAPVNTFISQTGGPFGGGGGAGTINSSPFNNGGSGGFAGGGGGGNLEGASSGGAGGSGGIISGSIVQGGGSGGDSNIPSQGANAQGGAIWNAGTLVIKGPATFSGSTLTPGIPAAPNGGPNGIEGWSIANPDNTPTSRVSFQPAPGNTIAFNESFFLNTSNFPPNPLTISGGGTVSITSPSNADFSQITNPGLYVFTALDISQASTLELIGVTVTVPGFTQSSVVPLPLLEGGPITVHGGSTIGGSGTIGGSTLTISSDGTGGTLNVGPGVFFIIDKVVSQPALYLNGNSTVQVNVNSTNTGTLFLFNNTNLNPSVPSGSVAPGPTTLHVNATGPLQAGSVYTLLYNNNVPFTGTFTDIVVTGTDAVPVYSPSNAPNAIYLPVGLTPGIHLNTPVIFGNTSIPGVVLFDPCGGIVVLNLTLPGAAPAALAAFAANQSQLTIQALGTIITTVNNQIVKRNPQFASAGGAAVAYREAKKLLAQAETSVVKEKKQEPKSPKSTPKYSLSFDTLGQWQHQDEINLTSALLPAFSTKSRGVILGCDYLGLDDILVGGALSYVYSDLIEELNFGNQKVQTALASAYSSFIIDHLSMDVLVTGSYNRNRQVRNFPGAVGQSINLPFVAFIAGTQEQVTFTTPGLPSGTAFSQFNSYQLVPQFDINYEIGFGNISLVPFLVSQCVMTFEDAFAETGNNTFTFSACQTSVSFNNAVDTLHTYMLQNEVGVDLFEQVDLKSRGVLIFRQKGSYINRYTFPYTLSSKFIQDPQFSELEVKLPVQHMFGSSAEVIYRLKNLSFILTYEGMVGSGLVSNAGYFRISQDF